MPRVQGHEARIRPHLYPGETAIHCVRGIERPPWSLLFFAFAFLLSRRCLIVATERRLLLLTEETWFGRSIKGSFASVPWGELERAELAGCALWRTLRISAHGGRWRREFRVRPGYEAHEGILALFRKKGERPKRTVKSPPGRP
jgi:hypothetical protein